MNSIGKTYTQAYNLNSTSTVTFGLTTRGYTLHEHLDKVNLINMPACRTLGRNGRLYDPLTARMLSPDNFVQDATTTQNFNRYSYCLNNPLKYTDPDGNNPLLLLGMFIGGAINVVSHADQFNSFGDFIASFAIGAGAGLVGSLAGGAVANSINFSGFLGGALSGGVAGGVTGFLSGTGNSLVSGNNFRSSINDGFTSGAYGALFGGISGGFIAGISAASNDYSFWDGGLTLEEKLDLYVARERANLIFDIGEADAEVILGTNKNFKNFGRVERNSGGDIMAFDEKGHQVVANGFSDNGSAYGMTVDGYVKFGNNKIFLSKNATRGMIKGDLAYRETLFHEWFHCRDFYSGEYDYLFKHYNFDLNKHYNMMEFRAHSFNYDRYPTLERLILINKYAKAYWRIP